MVVCVVGPPETEVVQKFPHREVRAAGFRFSIKSDPKQPEAQPPYSLRV